jgi:hypothetical protein
MSTAYGLFNAEGLFEGPFWSVPEVSRALDDYRREAGEDADGTEFASAICGEHEEEPAGSCEICWAEEDEGVTSE